MSATAKKSIIAESEWRTLKIKEFAHTTSGGTPKSTVAKYYGGDIPWVKSGDLNDGQLFECESTITELGLKNSSAKLFKPGTVLIALYGATIGRLALLQFEAATNQAVCGITLPEDVDNKYLFYFLLSIRKQLIDQGKGGAQPNISQHVVREIEVPLAPPEQQKQIVAKIEELFSHIDAGIAALKQSKQLLKQYRQSVLKAAVTGELSKEWREQNKEFRAERLIKTIIQEKSTLASDPFYKRHKTPEKINDDEKYFDIPNPWEWVRMAEVCLKITDGAHNTPKTLDHGFPYITAKDVVKGKLDFSCRQYISEKEHKELFNKCRPEPGDLLVVNIGAGSGNAALVPSTIDFEFSFKNIAILKLSKNVHPPYIYWYQEYRKEIVLLEQTRGGAQPFLSLAILNSLLVPLPSKEEQEVICMEIERMSSTIVELEKSIDSELKRSERLKQSVLQSAFGGELVK